MKRFLLYVRGYVLVGAIFLGFTRCDSNQDAPSPTQTFVLPEEVYRVANQNQLNSLKNAGMDIHEGTSPPNIAQIIYSPRGVPIGTTKVRFQVDHRCIFDNKNPANVGKTYESFQDSIYVFPNTSKQYEAIVKYVSINDRGSGMGFASGTGDKFTLFVKVTDGMVNRVPYQALWVISGTLEIKDNLILGIKEMKNCVLMLQKGEDPADQVANPGTIRIFEDADARRVR